MDWNFQASNFSNTKQQSHPELHKRPNFKRSNSYPRNIIRTAKSIMAGRRVAYIGLPVAAIGGYYLYAAGGDSKVAQKKAERLSTDNHNNHPRLQANIIRQMMSKAPKPQ